MKAKLREPHLWLTGDYMCLKCDARFHYSVGQLKCPSCRNKNRLDLVPFYVENDKDEEQLYTDKDFGEGD